jgi:hypothetical protein
LTLDADLSQAGFQRIMRLMASDALPIAYLRGFAAPYWESHLGVEERLEILHLLLRLQERDRQQALAVALELGAAWTHYGSVALPPELAGPVIQVLRMSLDVRGDAGAWSSLLESLAPSHPEEASDLVTDALRGYTESRFFVIIQTDKGVTPDEPRGPQPCASAILPT